MVAFQWKYFSSYPIVPWSDNLFYQSFCESVVFGLFQFWCGVGALSFTVLHHNTLWTVLAIWSRLFFWWVSWTAGKESRSVDPTDRKESASEVKDNEDNGIVRLTKAERRQKLKKLKREAKKQTKDEAKDEPAEGNLHSEVLVLVHLAILVNVIKINLSFNGPFSSISMFCVTIEGACTCFLYLFDIFCKYA